MKISSILVLISTLVLASCVQETASRNDPSIPAMNSGPRILAMGDSMMAAHKISGRAISNAVARNLREPVRDNSVVGASMSYALPITGAMGLNISKQFRGGQFDWVVLNGGGNDLWLGCGCNKCEQKMESLISSNGYSGKIPALVSKLRSTGAQVLWVGYLRSPGVGSPIEHCRDEGNELEARISKYAQSRSGIHFVSIADLVPHGDRSYHGADMIHPSLKASHVIGTRLSNYIRQHDPAR